MSTLKTNAIQTIAGKPILNSTGSIIQVQAVSQDITLSTSSTMNYSASLPTISQGAQLLSLSFTPTSSSSILVFNFTTYAYSSVVHNAIFALFEDSTCIAAIAPRHTYVGEAQDAQTILMHKSITNTTPKTYSVRAGCQPGNGATLYVNTYPRYVGVPQTSLVIMEVSG